MSEVDIQDCLFYIERCEASTFKTFIEVLKNLVSRANLIINESCIKIRERNSSARNLVIAVELDGSNFEKYVVNEVAIIAIEPSVLSNIFKNSNRNQIMIMYVLKNDVDHLHVVFKDEVKKSSKHCIVNLVEVRNREEDIEISGIATEIRLPSNELQRIIKEIKSIDATTVTIEIDCTNISFSAKGLHSSIVHTIESKVADDQCVNDIYYKETYSIDHFLLFIKSTQLSDDVSIWHPEGTNRLIVQYRIDRMGKMLIMPEPLDIHE